MKPSHLSYKIGDTCSRVMPRGFNYAIGRGLASNPQFLSQEDFAAVCDNLQVVFPQESRQEIQKKARRVFSNFSRYLVDLFYLDRLTRKEISKKIYVQGMEAVDQARRAGKPIIVASAHIGHWEMGAAVFSLLEYPIHAITIAHRDPKVESFFKRQRAKNKVKIISLDGGLRSCYQVLKKGEILALNADRLYTREGVSVQFFGKQVQFPRGIFKLSQATGAAVFPVFFVYEKKGYRLEICPPLQSGSEEAFVQSFATILEDVIRRHPDQWFIFQRFWEQPKWPI